MRFPTIAFLAALTAAGPALAQTVPQPTAPPAVDGPALAKAAQAPGFDPRLALPTIAALQAMLNLRESELKALSADSQAAIAKAKAEGEAREATLIEWLKSAQAKVPETPAPAPAPPAPVPHTPK